MAETLYLTSFFTGWHGQRCWLARSVPCPKTDQTKNPNHNYDYTSTPNKTNPAGQLLITKISN